MQDLTALRRHISIDKIDKLRHAINIRVHDNQPETLVKSILIKDKFKQAQLCSSKEIRESRTNKAPILEFKIGMRLNPRASLDWGFKVNRLTSTRHKNILLRVAHGDIYTKDKLFRYGMEPSNECPRCNQVEDLTHKFIGCSYAAKIWEQVKKIDRKLISDHPTINTVSARYILGAFTNSNKAFVTLAAEILGKIMGLRDEENFLIHPKFFVRNSIKALSIKEKDAKLRELYSEILREN